MEDLKDKVYASTPISEQRFHDKIDEVDQQNQKQHMRTRAWMIVLTAPSWGALIGAALGLESLMPIVAAIFGFVYIIWLKFGFLFHL